MAIETGAIYKSLTFGGINSRTYGVYITGAGVFNSPERDVEMISIPGRDGAFALDNGRYSNMEVTYPAGLFGVDPADFADAISDFRNAIGSLVGYQRLEDGYNPGEYRQAVFKAGLEVEPTNLEAGEFSITFDCKPQRFLTSGETAQDITSGDTITNPTPFDARPMLQAWGYGDIIMGNGEPIEIANVPLGLIQVAFGTAWKTTSSLAVEIDDSNANPGDPLISWPSDSLGRAAAWAGGWNPDIGVSYISITNKTVTGADASAIFLQTSGGRTGATYTAEFRGGASFVYGTAKTYQATLGFDVTPSGGSATAVTIDVALAYDGNKTITATQTALATISGTVDGGQGIKQYPWWINSSSSALGAPIYIDLDIGEAYKIENGVPVSVNNAVSIPAILPTLKPGSNTITYDNTITQFKVVPRWWKL